MHAPPPCPEIQILRRLLLGQVTPEQLDALGQHVEQCNRCVATLESLRAEDTVSEAARGVAGGGAPQDGLVDGLIERFASVRLPPRDREGIPLAPDTPDRGDVGREGYDFLDPPEEPGELGRLGPYRVLRVLGAGGMGVVFQAADPRLRRVVALKVILDARYADARHLARFEGEGQALARLQYPNIVQIHEVGRHRGRPYLALEFVAGGNLGQWLAGRPQPSRAAAELVLALARAVQHAHEQGVVHRDLKPANVLLSFSGRSQSGAGPDPAPAPLCERPLNGAVPKITDFGLAKRLDEEGLTRTGDLLGTPGYMAPELTRGHGPGADGGPPADVYGLGAILYELLTGRPPFRGASVADTLEQVRTLDPVPVRRLQPQVPRDLETVCLKCLEKEPGRRYATAAALADDLRRFLDGRPVRARPAGAAARLLRWARRRPALAALVAVSLTAAAALAGGGVAYERRLRQALAQSEANRRRADTNYHQARDAIRKILARSGEHAHADLPRLQQLRRAQQEEALAYFLAVADQQGDDPQVLQDVATACSQAGQLQSELGRPDDAKRNLERAAALFAGLAGRFPDVPDYRAGQATCLTNLGLLGGPAEGLRHHEQALALWEALVAGDPKSAAHREKLAGTHDHRGKCLWALKRPDEAERDLRRAVELMEGLVGERPDAAPLRRGLAEMEINLSLLFQTTNRPAEARAFHDRARANLERLVRGAPDDIDTACALALLRVNWAYVLLERGRSREALADMAENVNLLEPLLRREPEHAAVRDTLLRSHGIWATVLERQRRHAEEVDHRRRVVELTPPADRLHGRVYLATTLVRAGDHAAAFAEVQALGDVSSAEHLFYMAQVCGQAVTAVRGDAKLGTAEREQKAERYAARAVQLLGECRTRSKPGEWDKRLPDLRADAALKPLRDRPEFRRLMRP
jgi:tetratricopeptide (TPR) repeat protein